MAAMKGEPVTVKVTILTHIAPWWIYICPILSTICSAFALNRGAAWFIDMFVAARKYDRTLMRLRRLMPFAASSLAILMPAIGTLIGVTIAFSVDNTYVQPLKSVPLNPALDEYQEAQAWWDKLAYSTLLAMSASSAMICAMVIALVGYFKGYMVDRAQLNGYLGIIFAGGGLAGGTVGWTVTGNIQKINPDCPGIQPGNANAWKQVWARQNACMQFGFEGVIFGAVLCAIMSKLCTLILLPLLTTGVLSRTPTLGDVVRYLIKGHFYGYKHTIPGSPNNFILYMESLKLNGAFMNMLEGKQLLPGLLTLKAFITNAPFNAVSSRSFPINLDKVTAEGFSFEGESFQLNVRSPFDIVCFEFYIQEQDGRHPEKIADTLWDPWTSALLETYFENLNAVHDGKKKFLEMVKTGGLTDNTWNTKKTKVAIGIIKPGDFGAEKANRTSAAMSKNPNEQQALLNAGGSDPDVIGILHFGSTHLGPLRSLDKRTNPEDKPDRRGAMGSRLAAANPMASGLKDNYGSQWMDSRAEGQGRSASVMSSFLIS